MALATDRFGAVPAILGASLLLILLVGLFFASSRTLRELDSSVQDAISDREESELKAAA